MDVMPDEGLLLDLLNSTPVVDGRPVDTLGDGPAARAWLAGTGGRGTSAELAHVRTARELLQAVVRKQRPPDVLADLLDDVAYVPELTGGRVQWRLSAPPDRAVAVRAVLTWDALEKAGPGRLRPCANDDCRLFLVDHSKSGTARWCSMASCGNRMKARRHYQRAVTAQEA